MNDIELNKLEQEAATNKNRKWEQMIKRRETLYNAQTELRSEFGRDYTRVIYSNAYKRLKHKTQVFFSPTSDHICTRSEHVTQVDSISYILSKNFGLNLELTKTIALAHDLGHSPFGHQGERVLNKILEKDVGKKFWHEQNGLQYVDKMELLENREGGKQNLNLTYAVRDGIISHCGEIDENSIKPREDAIDLEKDYTEPNKYNPYTWEGCVVKISDKISYLGRDIEDAIRFKIIEEKDIKEAYKILNFEQTGYNTLNNTNIINYLNADLLKNSSIEKGLTFSEKGLKLINELKRINYDKIYNHQRLKFANKYFELILVTIYEVLTSVYDEEIEKIKEKENTKFYNTIISEFVEWLEHYCIQKNFNSTNKNSYNNYKIYDIREKKNYYEAVVRFISGMTDNKAISTYNQIIKF